MEQASGNVQRSGRSSAVSITGRAGPGHRDVAEAGGDARKAGSPERNGAGPGPGSVGEDEESPQCLSISSTMASALRCAGQEAPKVSPSV